MWYLIRENTAKFNIFSEFVVRDTGVCGKGQVNAGF
jgi:hypothetical protein